MLFTVGIGKRTVLRALTERVAIRRLHTHTTVNETICAHATVRIEMFEFRPRGDENTQKQ